MGGEMFLLENDSERANSCPLLRFFIFLRGRTIVWLPRGSFADFVLFALPMSFDPARSGGCVVRWGFPVRFESSDLFPYRVEPEAFFDQLIVGTGFCGDEADRKAGGSGATLNGVTRSVM